MLILDFVEERVVEDRPQRKIFRKRDKENNKELKRYSVNVNGRNVTILDMTKNY